MVHRQFTLYDLVADVTPGAVAIAVFVTTLPDEHILLTELPDIGVLGGVTFIVFAYVVGQLLQAISSPIDTRLAKRWGYAYPFEDEMSGEPVEPSEENNEEDQQSLEEVSVNQKFGSEIHDYFGARFDNTDLFFLTQSRLWNEDIGRMRRFQVLYTFFRSLWVIFALGTILHMIILGAGLCGLYDPLWEPLGSVMWIAGFGVSTWLAYKRRRKMHEKMAKTMVVDFYANILAKEDK